MIFFQGILLPRTVKAPSHQAIRDERFGSRPALGCN